jgi:hypothetical protein
MSLMNSRGLPIVNVEYPTFQAALALRPSDKVGYVSEPQYYEAVFYDQSVGIALVTRIKKGSSPRKPDLANFEDVLKQTSTLIDEVDDFVALQIISSPLVIGQNITPVKFVPDPLAPALNCTLGPVTVVVGSPVDYAEYHFISLQFSSAVLTKDVILDVIVQGETRKWLNFPAYNGDLVLSTDHIEGPGMQLSITVGQFAGTFDYLILANKKS